MQKVNYMQDANCVISTPWHLKEAAEKGLIVILFIMKSWKGISPKMITTKLLLNHYRYRVQHVERLKPCAITA